MTLKHTLSIRLFVVLVGLLWANVSSAAVQSSDNFDSGWSGTLPWTVDGNGTNSTTGWIVNNGRITGTRPAANSAPYACAMGSTAGAWIRSRILTNGIGYVTFVARQNLGTNNNPNLVGIESSYDVNGTEWVTNAIVTNLSKDVFTPFTVTNFVNPSANQFIRLRKYSTGVVLAIDDIVITYPAGSASVSDLIRSPSSPSDGEPVSVGVTVTLNGVVDSLAVTNFWRELPNVTWTAIAMTSNSPTSFTTSSNIPGKSAGAIIEYYAVATYTVESSTYVALTATNSYTPRPLTSYTNMAVTGAVSNNLFLTGNYSWQGVASLSNLVNAAIRFEGVSNGGTTSWGDTNQTAFTMPVYGTAETGTTSIVLTGTNTGYFVIQFNEISRAYSIQPCVFTDFDPLSNAPFGSYTNNDWELSDGQITNDAAHVFRGQTAVLNGSPNVSTNSSLTSPVLTNGIGQITFWYRNWETNATPRGSLFVQVAPSTTSTVWTTIDTITNIFSPDYLFRSVARSDRDNHCVRILNNPTGNTARICLDEVSIAEPGAGVIFANLSHSPAVPVCTNPVTVQVNIAHASGASITNVTLYYRPGASVLFTNSVAMANVASNLYTAVIPAGQGVDGGAGLVQYYVACQFSGFGSDAVSPLFAPAGGQSSPTNYDISRSYLVITNVTLLPTPPLAGTNIQIAADILPRDGASNITATAFYRIGSGAFSSLAMPYTGSANRFMTTNGIPAQTVPGTLLYYSIMATCAGGNPIAPTNYPVLGTNAPLAAAVCTPAPVSSYSNLQVSGSFSTNLILIGDYSWQGVATLSNAVNATFRFAGINGGTNFWGLTSQTISNFPYYGTAVAGEPPLTLFGTNTGHFVFEFNETNHAFMVRRCNYLNFDQWSNAAPYGSYTNEEGWILTDARTTTNSTTDDLRRFGATGRSGILRESPAGTNSYLRSPEMGPGVGQISFWYRNAETNASPAANFWVQSAATATSAWDTVATYTNILSPDYLYASIPYGNRSAHFVRILNDTNSPHAALCLDEIVITDPGAGVTPSNLTNSPSSPTLLDDVNISVDLTPVSGALVTNMVAWFRLGTNGVFDSLSMTNSGTHWSTAIPIHHPDVGTLQYAVQYFFTGFQSDISPAFYPSGGTNSSVACAVAMPSDARSENFDTGWPGVPWTVDKSGTNLTTGWIMNNGRVTGSRPAANSAPYAGALASTGISWLRSPWLTNAIGAVTFYARNNNNNNPVVIGIESSYDTDGNNWVTNSTITNANGSSYTPFVVTNLLNPSTNQFIRLQKYTSGIVLTLDDIVITYPPANVAISNVFINPGYPSTGDNVRVSCEVTSIGPMFTAYGISPSVQYRHVNDATFAALPMARMAGNRYEASIPSQSRDMKVEYYIKCDFTGYHGTPMENKSPQLYPEGGSNSPLSYIVRASQSKYESVNVIVNGAGSTGRLLRDSTWQAVFTTPTTNSLSISFGGNRFDLGSAYSDTVRSWGNSNNWQTTLPLADAASTGQNAFAVNGAFSGQYVMRFDENTGAYTIQQCVSQDFDAPGGGNGTPYKQSSVSSSTNNGVAVSFDSAAWPASVSQTRMENFESPNWAAVAAYTDIGAGGGSSFITFGMKTNGVAPEGRVMQTLASVTQPNQAFVAQGSHWDPQPFLHGLGTISATFRPITTNTPASMAFYLLPTNSIDAYSDFYDFSKWLKPPVATNGVSATNTFTPFTWSPKTNATLDVIFSATQDMYVAQLYVSDWCAYDMTANGWVAYQSWIEARTGSDNTCRLEASRAASGTEQYLISPAISGGVSTISFQYCGTTTTPVNVNLDVSFTPYPFTWTNLATIANVVFDGSRSTYSNKEHALMSLSSPIFVRIKNMTPAPGGLLIDNVQIAGFATTNDWFVNNAAVKSELQSYPPASRQYYLGAGYLNSNRTSEISTETALKPDTNLFPYIQTPALANGIGEISFWYRNWATDAATPARLVIEKSATGGRTPGEWSYVAEITNIVNTSDYAYFSTSIYDPSNRFVRIYNDDTFTAQVGRVCLDDIVVTAPLASTLSLSNLVTIPGIPLYTDRVDVAVDVYNLFYAPSNLVLTAYYGTASNYAGLASASVSGLPMTCIATNLSVPGRWYRYKTTAQIPSNTIDRYVKYYTEATFAGYHPEVNSPKKNTHPGVQPTWYNPLRDYTNNQAYYIVFSCPTGAVWINEFNIKDYSYTYDNQFVEICGKAEIDLRNWTLQVLNATTQTVATYTITNSTTLGNATNGFGFWVIGKSDITEKQQLLTNSLPTAGGIRLLRTSGTTADAVCYSLNTGTSNALFRLLSLGFFYAGNDNDSYDTSVTLTGYSTNGFAWALGPDMYMSPGSCNDGQFFVLPSDLPDSPSFLIHSMWLNDTNVWVECSGTSNWAPTPWYSTNLLFTNGWSLVMPFSSTYPTLSASNTYTLHFGSTNNLPVFYKIAPTNAP